MGRKPASAVKNTQEVSASTQGPTKPRTPRTTKSSTTTTRINKPKLDKDMDVLVKNIYEGPLTYVSRRTGYTTTWANFGDEDWLSLDELLTMRNSQPKFFKKCWVYIDDPEVTAFLGVDKYYQDALTPEEFEHVFDLDNDEMVQKLSKVPDGQRISLTYRAAAKIAKGEIDSGRKIAAIEKALGTKFSEE